MLQGNRGTTHGINPSSSIVTLDDLLFNPNCKRWGLRVTVNKWGGIGRVKNIEIVEHVDGRINFTRVINKEEVSELISTGHFERFLNGTYYNDVDELLSSQKYLFIKRWNNYIRNGGKVTNNMKKIANEIDPNFGKLKISDERWKLYEVTELRRTLDNYYSTLSQPNWVWNRYTQMIKLMVPVRAKDGKIYYSYQKYRAATGTRDLIDVVYTKIDKNKLKHLQKEMNLDHKQILYLPRFEKNLLDKAIVQRIFEYIDSRFPAWRPPIENSLKGQELDLNKRGVFSFDAFPINCPKIKNSKNIKFKVVTLDQTPILQHIGDTYWSTYYAAAQYIAVAKDNDEFTSFTLDDVRKGGFSPSADENYFFKTEQSPNSFTSACAYALQNENVQKLMGLENRVWAKKGEIIGGNHKYGIISTNPDVRIKTKEGNGGVIAQTKWIKDSMQHREEVVRDLVNTLGFGNSGINMWVLRAGTKVGGKIIEKDSHVIVIGNWVGESTELSRIGETIAGLSLLNTQANRSGVYDTWMIGLPRDLNRCGESSVVQRMFNYLNDNLGWRKGWKLNASVQKETIKEWLKWGVDCISESQGGLVEEGYFYNYMLKKVASRYFNKIQTG